MADLDKYDASNRICPYTRAECCNRNFYREGCKDCLVELEWKDKVMRGEVEPFKCPYTGKPCKDWDCTNCVVEKEEVEWMMKMEGGDDE